MKYVILTMDKHYYGYLTDKLPILALTTPNKVYYSGAGIPFINIEEVELEHKFGKLRE